MFINNSFFPGETQMSTSKIHLDDLFDSLLIGATGVASFVFVCTMIITML